MAFNLFVCVNLLCIFFLKSECGPVVTVEQGQVRGTVNATLSGRVFYSFRGIPYARPPVGNLRFKAPVPACGWDDVFDATKDSDFCIQITGGSEDCLTLNVYTPKLPDKAIGTLPVMVFIHGGAFAVGQASSYVYGPEYFMEKDVVLVTIAYRLGPIGFLSTGDEAASGNFGLLDQILALKWVRDNIASFSGYARKVTIFGESAGAASTSYLILSPAAANLFRGAITESGSALNSWAIQPDPKPWAVALGNKFNCPNDNTTLLISCLRGQSAAAIVAASLTLGGYAINIAFLPVVENPKYGKVITQQPIDIIKSGKYNKVPIISGVNKDEGILTYGRTQQYYTTLDDTFYQIKLPTLLLALTNYRTNLVNVSYAIKAEYFDKIDVNNNLQVIRTAIDFNSDCGFKAANDLFVRSMAANRVPVYMYTFEYAGFVSKTNYSGETEITHGDELFYLFNFGIPLNQNDGKISDKLIDLWTNFAIRLNPNPIRRGVTWWPTRWYSIHRGIQYLRIQKTLSMQNGYRTEQMNFWNKEVPKIVYGYKYT